MAVLLALIFLHGLLVYEIIPASSARFPCLNIRSRDRSPPVQATRRLLHCGRRQGKPWGRKAKFRHYVVLNLILPPS